MAEQQRLGYDFFKIYNNISPSTFDGIVTCSRSTGGFRFAGHARPGGHGAHDPRRRPVDRAPHRRWRGRAAQLTAPAFPPNPATDRGCLYCRASRDGRTGEER